MNGHALSGAELHAPLAQLLSEAQELLFPMGGHPVPNMRHVRECLPPELVSRTHFLCGRKVGLHAWEDFLALPCIASAHDSFSAQQQRAILSTVDATRGARAELRAHLRFKSKKKRRVDSEEEEGDGEADGSGVNTITPLRHPHPK